MRVCEKMVLLITSLFVISGCTSSSPSISREEQATAAVTVRNVVRIMMHEPHKFTFLVQNENKTLGQLTVSVYGGFKDGYGVKLVRDLSQNEALYVEMTCGNRFGWHPCKVPPANFTEWTTNASWIVVHLRSANDIGGAGWNHGKFGSGMTEIVQ